MSGKAPTCVQRARLWQGVWQDVATEGTPAVARRGAAIHLRLDLLSEILHSVGRTAAPPEDAHRREKVCVSAMRQTLHPLRSSQQAREDAQQGRQESGQELEHSRERPLACLVNNNLILHTYWVS